MSRALWYSILVKLLDMLRDLILRYNMHGSPPHTLMAAFPDLRAFVLGLTLVLLAPQRDLELGWMYPGRELVYRFE